MRSLVSLLKGIARRWQDSFFWTQKARTPELSVGMWAPIHGGSMVDQEETARSKYNRREIANQNTSVHSHGKSFPKLSFPKFRKWDKTSFNVTGEAKNCSWASRCILVLLLKGLSWNPTTFPKKTNCWAWNQWKSAKTRRKLWKTMLKKPVKWHVLSCPIYIYLCV